MNKKREYRLLALMPYRTAEGDYSLGLVRQAAEIAGERTEVSIQVFRADETFDPDANTSVTAHVQRTIAGADLVVAIVTNNINVVYEVGYADALGKPVILVADEYAGQGQPFLLGRHVLWQGRGRQSTDFRASLVTAIAKAIEQPTSSAATGDAGLADARSPRPTVFISYSHVDREPLARLQVHLRPLVREGRMDSWDDTRIRAGDRWREEVTKALERAAIAILLVSADYLASDFVVDNELPPLLRAAEQRGTRVLPVILKPCRFLRDPSLNAFQAINDPSAPISRLTDNDAEEVYAHVAEAVENALSA